MEKRTILAMILSLIVVIGFQWYQAKTAPLRKPAPPPPPANGQTGGANVSSPTPTAQIGGGSEPSPVSAVATTLPDVDAPLREDLKLESDVFVARLSNEGAKVLSFTLKDPQYADPETGTPLDLLKPSRSSYPALILESRALQLGASSRWRIDEEGADRIVFSRPLPDGGTLTKTIAKTDKPYSLDVTLTTSPASIAIGDYSLVGTTAMTPEDEGRAYVPKDQGVEGTIFGVAGIVKESNVALESELAKDLPPPEAKEHRERAGNTTFGGAASKYFAVVLIPAEDIPSPTLFLEQVTVEIGYGRPTQHNVRSGYRVVPPARRPLEHRFTFFAGPKVDEILGNHAKAKLIRLLDFSSSIPFAEALSTLFLNILKRLHSVVGSYGVAIILLTLIVRIMLHPLSRASTKNMMKMQKLAPKIKEIQEKYKGKKSKESAQKMNLEVMEVYRSHGTSPLLGCLPTLLQFPVFIGLYNALAYSIELRGTRFLYIRDLSRPDHLFTFGGVNVPYIGGYFNLLPILMVITMVIQQRMQPTPPDPQQQQQAKMMQYMMIFFGVLFYHVPSGLVLYFLTSSLLGMLEQKWVKHQLQRDDADRPG